MQQYQVHNNTSCQQHKPQHMRSTHNIATPQHNMQQHQVHNNTSCQQHKPQHMTSTQKNITLQHRNTKDKNQKK